MATRDWSTEQNAQGLRNETPNGTQTREDIRGGRGKERGAGHVHGHFIGVGVPRPWELVRVLYANVVGL